MGKATKNGTSSGVDERLKSIRRCKATSISSEATSVGESETSSRLGGTVKQQPVATKNNPKSKLRSPSKVGLSQSTNRVIRASTSKATKVSIELRKTKNFEPKMKPETDTTEKKQKVDNKESNEQIETNKQNIDSNNTHESSNQHENGNSNELNGNEEALTEMISQEKCVKQNGDNNVEDNAKEDDFKLQLEVEESQHDKETVTNNDVESNKTETNEDLKTESEKYSEDVVESTTSESTEVNEASKKKKDEINDSNGHQELKTATVVLSDCTKNEENNVDQSQSEYPQKQTTFGRSIRTVSARKSLGRMRNTPDRNRQPSPNSSLFVNTSLSEDADFKILHHRSGLLSNTANGTPVDRKRKIVHELAENRTKKIKLQDSAYSALEILKYPFSPKKPAQVSTPFNVKMEKNNINISQETKADSANNKWCILM